jgi:Leucine-rich repeat (LRR) protein
VKKHYKIEIKQSQISRFVPKNFQCSMDLTHGNRDTEVFGKAINLETTPLKVEFSAPHGSHQRLLFESLLQESIVTQQFIDLKIECSMLLYGSLLNENSSQMHRLSFYTSEFEDESKSNYCEKSLFSGYDVDQLKDLHVTSDLLRSIPKGFFKKFWNLMNLTFFRDETETINERIDSVQEVHVFKNKMRLFPQTTIIGFENPNENNNPADEDFLDESVFQGTETTLRNLEIRNFNISSIPDNVFNKLSNLRVLKLIKNGISLINSSAFAGQVQLTELNLTENLISLLLPNTFDKLASLEVLDLSRNKIAKIEDGLFKGLDSLKVLRFSSNSINFISSHAFAELEKLEELDLSKNLLGIFHKESIISNTVLKILNISGNKIKEFHNLDLDKFKNLIELDISNNELNTSNYEISKSFLGELTQVYFSHNQFINIPYYESQFHEFSIDDDYLKIKEMDLSHNNLTSVRKGELWIYRLVDKINLSHNQINVIEENSLNWEPKFNIIDNSCPIKSIKSYVVNHENAVSVYKDFEITEDYHVHEMAGSSDCHFKSERKNISERIVSLKWLSISHNKIKDLPAETFKQLGKLEELYLDWNQIVLINESLFHGLESLRVLDLSNNRLEKLPENVFNQLTRLIRLDLSWNNLEVINYTTLAGLGLLKRLQCGFNKIKLIEQNSFADLNKLQFLDLSHNKLEMINENDFEELEELDIRGNKIRSTPKSKSCKLNVRVD